MNVYSITTTISKHIGILVFIPILAMTACASIPKSASLPLAKSALETAQSDKLNEFAPLELRIARDEVEEAEQAAREEEHLKAERLAQKALANIKLAEAKAEMKKSEVSVQQIEESIRTLREEIQRK